MRNPWAPLICLCLLGATTNAYSQAGDSKSFETKMYSIEKIDQFGTSREKLAATTEEQRRNLLDARSDLMGLLQAVQHRHDPTRYVTQEMARKYPTPTALAGSIVDAETSILAAGVSDFTISDRTTVKLKFFAMVHSEGDVLISEKVAVLRNTDSGWRVSGIE